MVIMAHPDDAEFGCAGTVGKWAREGDEITYVVCTNGDKGSDDPTMTPQRLSAMREGEQRAAADILGVRHVVFLGYPDGDLEPTPSLRRDLTREIRRYRPEIVVTTDPTTRFARDEYINHPDHRAAGEAAMQAVFPASRDRLHFPELLSEGLMPHKVKQVYLTLTNEPNQWVDISEVVELKIQALRAHVSQFSGWEGWEEVVLEWARTAGAEQGLAYAEAYRRIVIEQ